MGSKGSKQKKCPAGCAPIPGQQRCPPGCAPVARPMPQPMPMPMPMPQPMPCPQPMPQPMPQVLPMPCPQQQMPQPIPPQQIVVYRPSSARPSVRGNPCPPGCVPAKASKSYSGSSGSRQSSTHRK
jgi:hypothetical protein